ncbi:type I DNA topoisomerase [[Haemophilus] ducreyi]|uniref:type I DNA topoisomerase n=1 Tax=Haemophilus ducreyi TaxID=730 RepID=UPI000654BDE3|nr:type I DNA topoisomerase [[Haemophilus] ducreyi]AKO45596.1 DNA topoisomerase I [[Haemophilus] ducreyi]AKO46982.1 DNA topoisomerase I [[Haemophilus] ducreyi]AKO48326.1 DNA topoisomerase I [[Haemophilus] ducreyi]AKO49714.1 DNA topoisomerase I [[Haemophilus] ducreyi]ANF61318.1 DNA topoisomerase I subunit omega [[Haemophilus] ducreyi]
MGKSLVIVESPAKAKTINKYLGSDYIVKSSVGHIRDLPKSGSEKAEKVKPISTKGLTADQKAKVKADKARAALVKRMGIDPYHDWKANYQILPDKDKVVSELKSLAKKADHIYLATDLDREGEAIAWHLREVIGGKEEHFSRVVFNEITRNAIQKAFQKPEQLNLDRVNAQQTRRFLDRIVGFMVSPLLWKKVARGLSAGRVQSVAVKLLVEREREIKAFQPEEYWDILANTLAENGRLPLALTSYKGKKFVAKNQTEADNAVKALQCCEFFVSDIDKKPTSSKANAPFITSTLQQTASTRLSFGVKKTMMLAQRLYEAGYITYMRTDSINLSQDALTMVREYVENHFGTDYLPAKPNFYSSKENAQEAHEAIRPSDVRVKMSDLKGMEKDAERLYDLIWRRFVACQMPPARYDSTSLTITAGDYELKAKGRVLRFDGWTKVLPIQGKTAEDQELPAVMLNEKLTLAEIIPSQHFTKPPAHFSEAALVKELEKRGIGRPSTYATIISTIQERGYVRTENRRFYAEKMGEIVTDRLDESFSDLMNYDFTANMEETLDQIAKGNKNWKEALNSFFSDFSEQLSKAELDELEGGMKPNSLVVTDIDCPTCARKMAIRTASTGVFLGCTGYSLPPKERCKTTMNLILEAELFNVLDEESEAKALLARKRCPKCGSAMDSYIIDSTRKLHICGNNPNCDGHIVEQGSFKIKGYDGPIVECDKCGADMHLKLGRFGKYMACTACDNTRKILKNGEVAPPREEPTHFPELKCEKSDAYFVLRDGASGVFMSAHNFPKSRETRAPKVAELALYRDRLPAKLQYLADAPQQDPEGNQAIIRFSRKEKRQYVTSEKEGKATKWIVDFIDGKWLERHK